jgi:hypothetical protein
MFVPRPTCGEHTLKALLAPDGDPFEAEAGDRVHDAAEAPLSGSWMLGGDADRQHRLPGEAAVESTVVVVPHKIAGIGVAVDDVIAA